LRKKYLRTENRRAFAKFILATEDSGVKRRRAISANFFLKRLALKSPEEGGRAKVGKPDAKRRVETRSVPTRRRVMFDVVNVKI